MFGLFHKNKTFPTFEPLVTDMHCHLLPLVDDGSKSLEESLEVMEAMKATGFSQIRITPHFQCPRFPNTEAEIKEKFSNFCEEVRTNGVGKELPELSGISGEYRIDDGFEDHVKKGGMLTYHFADPEKGSEKGLLLVEFSLHQQRMGLEEAIFTCQMEGYDVIVAHPERYPYLDAHSSFLSNLKEQGVYFQVNIPSLDGFYGEPAQRKAFEFIQNGWVEFLGTDMHNIMYAQALRHASANKKIIKLLSTTEFLNSQLVVK